MNPMTKLGDIAEYYDNNDLAEEMEAAEWTRHDGVPAGQQSVSVSVRFSGQILQALRARAEARGVGYTTLIRELVEAGLARQDEQVPVSVILAAVAEYQQRKASLTRAAGRSRPGLPDAPGWEEPGRGPPIAILNDKDQYHA
jgi:predicted DNA binding CopG/RHH family protein